MAYQGSAQSIGFRNRNVIDPSKRMREEAAQIKEQGRERVREMERQASQQIQEMKRVSDLNAQNTNYELEALAKFSNTINETLEQQAEVYIEEERARGMMDYLNQPPEAYVEDEKEVNDAIRQSAKLHDEVSEFASKAPTQEVEAKVRQGSRYYKQGWDLAELSQSAQGFGAHLLTELQTSETVLRDPTTGEPFKIKDYQGREQWDAAAAYIKQEYIKNNNPAGLSAKVQATKFLPKINEAIDAQRRVFVKQFLQKENQEAYDSEQNLVTQAFLDRNNPVPLEQVITSFMKNTPRLLQNLGNPQPFVTARKFIESALTTVADIDTRRAREILPAILNAEIPHPSAKGGKGSLSKLYGDEFNLARLNKIINDASYRKFSQDQQATEQQAAEAYEAFLKADAETPLSPHQLAIFASQEIFQTTESGRLYANKILTHTRAFMSEDETRRTARFLMDTNGEITEEEAKRFNPEVRAEYEKHIVKEAFGSNNKSLIKAGEAAVEDALKRQIKNFSAITAGANGYTFAALKAKQEAMLDAKKLVISDNTISEQEALNQAFQNKVREIEDNNEVKQGKYYLDNNTQSFQHFTRTTPTSYARIRQKQYLDIAESEKVNANPDLLRNELIISDPRDLQLDRNGRPYHFFYELAKKAGGRYTAYELLNFQRSLTKDADGNPLKPVELPVEAKTLDDLFKQRPDLRRSMITYPSPRLANRTIRQLGGISSANVLRALGYKESSSFDSSDYKARNDDPATKNDRDPALGKYQILWSNVVEWGPKYGLGKPATQQEFLNDGEYQEALAQAAMGEYLRQALNYSGGNPDIAIRMAAAMWYGGPRNWSKYDSPTYGTTGGYDSMRKYTTDVLNYYKGM